MTLPQNVKDRIQKLSDRKLGVWQDMAERWDAGSTAPVNADAFLSLIVEVKHQRAHLLSQEAEIADYKNASLHAADDCVAKDAEIARLQLEIDRRFGIAAEMIAARKERDNLQSRLAAANALLRECVDNREGLAYEAALLARIQSHLQGAGDE